MATFSTIKAINDDNEDEATYLAQRLRLERRHTRAVQAALEAQLAAIVAEQIAMGDVNAAAERIEGEETDNLRNALLALLFAAVALGVDNADDQLAEISLSIDTIDATETAREWARTYSYELVRGLNANSKRMVSNALREWIGSGRDIEELASELAPIFGRKRAEVITITETTRAFNQGYIEGLREAGIERKQWWTRQDERVCPICRPLHGKTLPLDEMFETVKGDLIIGPPAHPRCRCTIVGVI